MTAAFVAAVTGAFATLLAAGGVLAWLIWRDTNGGAR